MSTKTISQKFKKLDEIEHVLIRPGRYIGSISPHTANSWVPNDANDMFYDKEITWNPGLIKTFDEIVSNSVDASKDKDLPFPPTTIKVEIDTDKGIISVFDDGGIPVELHPEENQYLPEMIFGELRAGSNFDDSDQSDKTGQNGEGAALTNIFSEFFTVETADGKNKFIQTFSNNMRDKTDPKITKCDKHYTKITWQPSESAFGASIADEGVYKKLCKRVIDAAGCNPRLKVYLNKKQIRIKSFKDYIEMYTNNFHFDENSDWRIGIAPSEDGFKHVSFVNGTESSAGGTHVNYVSMQICNAIREYIKKKYKKDVKPSQIREHFMLFIDARIINPRYSSQTKEDLITEVSNYGTSYSVPEKFINKIIKSDIIASIIDWLEAKAAAEEAKALRAKNKEMSKTNLRSIVKYTGATSKDRSRCILFVAEGDSACGGIKAAPGKEFFGSYPLKGKPKNALDVKATTLVENKEISDLMKIIGLEIGTKVASLDELRYGKMAIMTDADPDGYHICGLLLNFFNRFWPELFELGFFGVFRTPYVKTKVGKDELWFYTEREYHEWAEQNKDKKFTSKYYKGLGTSSNTELKEYLKNIDHHLVNIVSNDKSQRNECINLAFNKKRADDRKKWLAIEESA